MSQGNMLDNQKVVVSVGKALDAAGFPVPSPVFDAPLAWTASPDGLVVAPSADGLSCEFTGAPGTYTVNASGAVGGVVESGSGSLVVSPGAAVSFELVFGAAQPK